MTTLEELPENQQLHSKVIGYLDSSGGISSTLANALHAAKEAGFDVHREEDLAATMDSCLQRAFEEAEEGPDADPEEVIDWVDGARQAASDLTRVLDDEKSEFVLPDHVDSGVYDTLGEWIEYVYRDSLAIQSYAEMWAESEL